MAFIFVVETGNGDPDANSYTTVEFADDYISINAFVAAAWAAAETEEKEKFLVRASKYLDRVIRWAGTRLDDESGLRWPRSGVFDVDGFEIPDNVVPEVLQEAVCELAAILANGDDWTSQSSTYGMKEIQVDVIDLKFDTDIVRGSVPDYIVQMLAGLGVVTSSKRPQFKPIIRS